MASKGPCRSGDADSRSATTTSLHRPRARAASSASRSSAVTLQPWAVRRSARKPSAAPTSSALRPRPSPSRERMTEWLECGSSFRWYVMSGARRGGGEPRLPGLVARYVDEEQAERERGEEVEVEEEPAQDHEDEAGDRGKLREPANRDGGEGEPRDRPLPRLVRPPGQEHPLEPGEYDHDDRARDPGRIAHEAQRGRGNARGALGGRVAHPEPVGDHGVHHQARDEAAGDEGGRPVRLSELARGVHSPFPGARIAFAPLTADWNRAGGLPPR